MDQDRQGRAESAARLRVTGILGALLLAALLAAPAGAEERFGLVGAVDRSAGTMSIDGELYTVDRETAIRNAEGSSISFAEFPVPAELEAVAVYYEADGDRLRSVRITDLPR